ncbi:energy transducer TonB [Dyadobacter fanqingshengii]|uniref:TonB C-terminal domain-containing protein n=1 Tax=Dyadobacter fanqingshengii TaxID=2906443 RepID=A0A9X1PAV1_9BACT|nr:energy transducer TonB [Dyadobacter fanqingshengii]MCF0041866.1 hypothetical protein [Dyadobacter fanqingshengii]USJ36425.1 hypothetical protein NFI81_01355 [Dyadobacter fanqingshengii]
MAENRSDRVGFEDFRRYQSGEMSLREQHLLEKQMLEDPMLAEAYEGFLAMQRNNADFASIKNALNRNLGKRIKGNRKRTIPIWAYGAAASLVITMGTLWLVFVSNPQKGDITETGQNLVERPLIKPETKPQSAPETNLETALPVKKTTPRTKPATQRAQEPELVIEVPAQQTETDLAVTNSDDQVNVPASAPAEKQAFANTARTQPPAAAASRLREEPKHKRSHTVVAEETSARGLAALPDVTNSLTKLTASPLMGWDAYRVYLEKQSGAARRKGEVTVSFYVNADGTLTDFTAEGKKQLHSEGIRIVREGPQWVPVKQHGSTVRTPVSVTLQFRK